MERHEIKEKLNLLAQEEYRGLALKLLPGEKNLLGVRLPQLRKLAKQIAADDAHAQRFLTEADYAVFEEAMLCGMVIGYMKPDFEKFTRLVEAFLPHIRNWSICDSFCSGLKSVKGYAQQYLDFIRAYAVSDDEFTVRFAAVMLLNYYINAEHISTVLHILSGITHSGYYAQTAVSWALAECYVRFPRLTLRALDEHEWDSVVYKKALRKILESKIPSASEKQEIRSRRNRQKQQ